MTLTDDQESGRNEGREGRGSEGRKGDEGSVRMNRIRRRIADQSMCQAAAAHTRLAHSPTTACPAVAV